VACRGAWGLVVSGLLSALTATAWAAPRRALVIGSNEGLGFEPVLEFAEQDARRISKIFADFGGMSSESIRLLTGRPLSELKAALQALSSQPSEEVWFFISGHAGADGMHVAGEIWPWKELREALEGLPAKRRLGLVDACSSGAVLTAKGISFESQLKLRVEPNVRGLALLTSSGANELSYESRLLSGSPFAHFLATGLRGAADQNRDGDVTLAEVYTYLYARTVAASLDGREGPQHPTQAGWYLGQGEWTLTRTRAGKAALKLSDSSLGQCFVLDETETSVIAELRSSDPASVQLDPGRYRIKCVSESGAFAASADLGPGTTEVEALAFASVDKQVVLARGPGLTLHRRLALAAGIRVEPSGLEEWTTAAWVNDYGPYAFEIQLGVSQRARASSKLGLYGTLPWWSVLNTRLDVGLSAAYVTDFAEPGEVTIGPLVQLSFHLAPELRVFVRQEVLRSINLSTSAEDSLPLVTSAGLDWDFDK
jgi:hypothetical protein